MIEMRWVEHVSKRGVVTAMDLHVGFLTKPIAHLQKAAKWWSAYIELPGVHLKPYAPLSAQKEAVEIAAREWLALALSNDFIGGGFVDCNRERSLSASAQKERHLSADMTDNDQQRPGQALGETGKSL